MREIFRRNLDSASAQLVERMRLISDSLHRNGVGDEFVVDDGLFLVLRAISLQPSLGPKIQEFRELMAALDLRRAFVHFAPQIPVPNPA